MMENRGSIVLPAKVLPEEQRAPAIPSIYQEKALALQQEENPRHIIQLLETGDDALLARLHLIRAARSSIKIQTFMWRKDGVTRVLFDELMQAADRGVEVRLLVDAFFDIGTSEEQARLARAHEGVEIRAFNPFSPNASIKAAGWLRSFLLNGQRMNRRMHHKVMLVDDRIAIVGGRNYKQKYYDRDPYFLFRDRDLLVIGPETKSVQRAFDEFWTHRWSVELGQFYDVRRVLRRNAFLEEPSVSDADRFLFRDIHELASAFDPTIKRESLGFREVESLVYLSDSPSRLYRAGPHDMTRRTRELIRAAREQIVLQTPYLIYDRRILRDLDAARKNNPDLRVKVSGNGLASVDHVYVYAISFKYRKALFRRMRLEIYKMKPFPDDRAYMVPRLEKLLLENGLEPEGNEAPVEPKICVHAKTLVVDSRAVLIGSSNFDPRSFDINSECGFLIEDAEFAREVEDDILRDIHPRNSWVVGKRLPNYRIVDQVNRRIGTFFMHLPVMDIWPHTFTSVFEMNEDGDVRSPFDPDFYEHYEDMGLFPEAYGIRDRVVMLLMRTFGGWSRRFM